MRKSDKIATIFLTSLLLILFAGLTILCGKLFVTSVHSVLFESPQNGTITQTGICNEGLSSSARVYDGTNKYQYTIEGADGSNYGACSASKHAIGDTVSFRPQKDNGNKVVLADTANAGLNWLQGLVALALTGVITGYLVYRIVTVLKKPSFN